MNVSLQVNVHATRIRRVWWIRFLRISIEVFPVTILEDILFGFGIGFIKYKFGVVVMFQVSHHMQSSLKMYLSRIRRVRQKYRHFCCNVNTTNFNDPAHNANNGLKIRCLRQIQGFGRVHNSFIPHDKEVFSASKQSILTREVILDMLCTILSSFTHIIQGIIPQATTPFFNFICRSLAPIYMSGSPVYPGFNLKYLSILFKTAME